MNNAVENVSLKSKEQLKRWLRESNRLYLVFDAIQLVDSLDLEGVATLVSIITAYAQYRGGISSGKTKVEKNLLGEPCEVPVFLSETLSDEEIQKFLEWIKDGN